MKNKGNTAEGRSKGTKSIGIDFDNTIVCYEKIFQDLAVQNNWIKGDKKLTKNEIKNTILNHKNGVMKWKTMQSLVYSDLISKAIPMRGVFEFFKKCNINNVEFYIVSHKTEHAEITTSGNNLRFMAMNWLINNFSQHQLNLPINKVYFENTREDKIKTIKSLNCTHFVDDLEEVLCHSQFPKNVKKILLSGCNNNLDNQEIVMKKNWNEIEKYVFN